MDWLPHGLPGIAIDASNVKILETPSEFYQILLERSASAKERISLSSLYLGDGKLETALVKTIDNNVSANDRLKVSVLLDFLRGTRGVGEEKSSTTLLKTIADRAEVFLYHTPDLSGVIKRILPERSNEIIGLQHMKLYIFDDSLVISGANLSDSYFTNRQDRYVLFEDCKPLADFFHSIITAVGSCSFVLQEDGSTVPHRDCSVHPFQGKSSAYRQMIRDRIDSAIERFKESRSKIDNSSAATVVYPIIQMGPLGIHQEFDLLKTVFSRDDPEMKITMASGYFNCIQDYEHRIFLEGTYKLDVFTASPMANGFFGASGYSGYVPSMYSNVAKTFIEKRGRHNRESVQLFEYSRPGWTFHAKGLWLETRGWLASLIGSSNYGFRSVHRDLEAQVLLVTSEEELVTRFQEESSKLFEFSTVLDAIALRRPEHHVPFVVKALSRFIRNFF